MSAQCDKLLHKKIGPVTAELTRIGKIIESVEGPHSRGPRCMLVTSVTSLVQAGKQRHAMQK